MTAQEWLAKVEASRVGYHPSGQTKITIKDEDAVVDYGIETGALAITALDARHFIELFEQRLSKRWFGGAS